MLVAEWSGCSPAARPLMCDQSGPGKYRSISGSCNNRYLPEFGPESQNEHAATSGLEIKISNFSFLKEKPDTAGAAAAHMLHLTCCSSFL